MAYSYYQDYASGASKESKWLKFVRFYLVQGVKLCRMNPAGKPHGFGPLVRSDKMPAWSQLVQIFYFYFTVKLLASLTLQREYNQLTWDLGQVNGGVPGSLARSKIVSNQTASGGGGGSSSALSRDKQAQLELVVSRLELIGNAYYEFGFAIEPLFLFLAYFTYLAYLHPRIYVRLSKNTDPFDLLRVFIDPQRYADFVLVPEMERQAARYTGSSANYLKARLASAHGGSGAGGGGGHRRGGTRTPTLSPTRGARVSRHQVTLRRLELAHARDTRQVAELLAHGHLVPHNRQPGQVERLAKLYCLAGSLLAGVSYAVMLAVFVVLPRSHPETLRLHNGPRDLLFQAELLCYCMLFVKSFAFYMTMMIMRALDLIHFVTALRRLLRNLIDAPGSRDDYWRNWNLVRVTILYKLLKEQLRASGDSVAFMLATLLFLMLTPPVIGRLYVTRMATQFRQVYLCCALYIIICSDLLIVPSCWLHARCLDMLHLKSSLLSRIDSRLFARRDQEASSSGLSPWRASHEEHAVCLLRREQYAPDLAAHNFSINAYFMRLTYASLLGVHFWCGLLLAPMCMRNTGHPLGANDNLLTLIF